MDAITSILNLRHFIHFIKLDEKNRMLRAGFGKNDGEWFARLDLWFGGIRFSRT